jgi:hypothetical protein
VAVENNGNLKNIKYKTIILWRLKITVHTHTHQLYGKGLKSHKAIKKSSELLLQKKVVRYHIVIIIIFLWDCKSFFPCGELSFLEKLKEQLILI